MVLDGHEIRLRNRKTRAVLSYLALSATGEETRERLVGLLWSESSEEKGRASLRQVVHELREALPPGLLAAERLSLVLDLRGLTSDVEGVNAALAAGEVPLLLLERASLTEELLQGHEDLDPAFNVWLLAKRQSLHDAFARRLEALLDATDTAVRRQAARALLNLDPTHEEACRRAMQAAVADGDIAGALRLYESLWNLLGEDFDMEPSPATQELVAAIKSGSLELASPRPAPPPPAARPAQPATGRTRMLLRVCPFAAHGVPEGREHLVQGFRHDLMGCLARFREWFVLDGSTTPTEAAIAGRVSSRYAIDGTAFQAGTRVSLVLTLSDTESGVVVWSEKMGLDLETWFEAQTRLVRGIAMSLNGQISSARMSCISGGTEVSLAAHDRWLLGQSIIRGFSPEHWERARTLFREAIAEDANFSPAYSSLAQLDNVEHIVNPGIWRDRAREERSLVMARRAVQLDPMDSRAQLCLGWSLAMARQHDRATTPMALACELNPYDTWTLISAALFHAFCGNHAEAARLAAESLEMTLSAGRTHWGYQVTIAYLRGDDQATVEACDRAEDCIRALPAWRAAALFNLGDIEGARRSAAQFFELVRPAWRGQEDATEASMARWLLHLYPISRAETWERLRHGVAGAGIEAAGLSFGDW
ncbi:BTAD domain-containing putative transcriptional regulator [Sabulicella rubraurantiaca]|uniref:BTAD domain-containing putative transcriptional regulator n=1 Tax=Sabulicella rubraurantiaca TaxID=2811429 RepID=UPI001A958205|nr:BTAD domain-containing putative transcriptional regulator [Sabulicella rubraurantiaca]